MKELLANITKLFAFKLAPHGFYTLFVGVTIGFGLDYLLNKESDNKLSIFIFLASIILSYFVFKIIFRIKDNISLNIQVGKLSEEEMIFALKCHYGDEYFHIRTIGDKSSFDAKWLDILVLATGSYYMLFDNYKIIAYRKAIKKIKKRLPKASIEEIKKILKID